MTPQEMIACAHRGLLLGPSPLLRHQPGSRRLETEGMVLVRWGATGPALNKVMVVGPTPPLARIVERADAFFAEDSGGYGIVVEADAGHPVETELRQAGWQVFEDEPALVLPSIPPAPSLPPGLEVKRVQDTQTRRDLAQVLVEGFGVPTSADSGQLALDDLDSLVPSLACASDPAVAMLVGYLQGKPVSSAIVFLVGSIATLTGVATIPAARRRGLGTALTWQAIGEGAARGGTCATLAAQGASFDLYRKMGFVHVCNHRAYQPPA